MAKSRVAKFRFESLEVHTVHLGVAVQNPLHGVLIRTGRFTHTAGHVPVERPVGQKVLEVVLLQQGPYRVGGPSYQVPVKVQNGTFKRRTTSGTIQL